MILAVSPKVAKQCISSNEIHYFLDVRSPGEQAETGTFEKSVKIPYYDLISLERWSRENADSKKTILLFCRKGRRASFVSRILEGSGTWGRILYVHPGGYTDLV
jgi:rhodanese-related sulfurtransferase